MVLCWDTTCDFLKFQFQHLQTMPITVAIQYRPDHWTTLRSNPNGFGNWKLVTNLGAKVVWANSLTLRLYMVFSISKSCVLELFHPKTSRKLALKFFSGLAPTLWVLLGYYWCRSLVGINEEFSRQFLYHLLSQFHWLSDLFRHLDWFDVLGGRHVYDQFSARIRKIDVHDTTDTTKSWFWKCPVWGRNGPCWWKQWWCLFRKKQFNLCDPHRLREHKFLLVVLVEIICFSNGLQVILQTNTLVSQQSIGSATK